VAGLPPQKARRAAVPHARDGACHTTSTFSEASWSDEGRGGWEPGCPTGIGRVHRTAARLPVAIAFRCQQRVARFIRGRIERARAGCCMCALTEALLWHPQWQDPFLSRPTDSTRTHPISPDGVSPANILFSIGTTFANGFMRIPAVGSWSATGAGQPRDRVHRRSAMRAVRRPPPFGGQRSAGGNRRSADVIGRFCWWSNSTLLTVAALTLETVGPSGGLQAAASLEMGQFWCSSCPNPSRPGLRRGLIAAAVPTPCQVPTHFAVMGFD